MANPYRRGNNFERVQSPPYFIANKKIFWPSLPWETCITIAAADPLHITRPNVQPQMVPLLFFDGVTDGLLIDTINVRYLGPQNSVNTLFVYDLIQEIYYCLGAIALPISANYNFPQPAGPTSVMGQGDPGALLLPPVVLGNTTQKFGLRLEATESIYLGIAQELTSPIVVTARGQLYTKLERIAASTGAET